MRCVTPGRPTPARRALVAAVLAGLLSTTSCSLLGGGRSAQDEAEDLAKALTAGPTYANSVTKRMLQMEWAMGIDAAIDAEAIAQALCMKTGDFRRAFEAFAAKKTPRFEGN